MDDIWDKWEEHYRKNNIEYKRICKDGILNEQNFANPRVLFIMKDVNKFEGGDLREMLKNGPTYQMWHTVARWSAGTTNNFPAYEKIDNNDTMREALSKIATINLKKISGGSFADMSVINAYAFRDKELLLEQITRITPKFIVACGTFDILIWLLGLEEVKPDNPRLKPIHDKTRDTWVVPFVHPSRVNNKKTYDDLKSLIYNIL